MLSATALKNRESGHTNTARVLREGTDERDKNYRRHRRALKWGIMEQAKPLQSRKRRLKCRQKSVHLQTARRKSVGKKPFSPSSITSRGIKWSKEATLQERGGSSQFSCELRTGWWRCQRFIMVTGITNTGLNEKSLSGTVQQITPLLLELPELQITHGWELVGKIFRLQECSIHFLCPDN